MNKKILSNRLNLQRNQVAINQLVLQKRTIVWALVLIFLTFLLFSLPGLYCYQKTKIHNRRINYRIADFLYKNNSVKLKNYYLKKDEEFRAKEVRQITMLFVFLLIFSVILFVVCIIRIIRLH